MLYGTEVWEDSLRLKKYRKRIVAVQRSYQTLSELATKVLPGVIPIGLQAKERRRVNLSKLTLGKMRHQKLPGKLENRKQEACPDLLLS